MASGQTAPAQAKEQFMRSILDTLVLALEQSETVVLATIVHNAGSAPRTTGARMLVRGDGSLAGSVGGGALEGDCQARSAEMLAGGIGHAQLEFSLSAASAAEQGMVCGGDVTVLLQRLGPEDLEQLRPLREEWTAGRRPVLVTALGQGEAPPRMFFITRGEERQVGRGERAERAALMERLRGQARQGSFLTRIGTTEYFLEPLIRPTTVHLVGAGHVALATAECAAFAGFEIVVMDDREDFANRDRYPRAREVRVVPSFTDCLGRLGRDDYVVIVTRGHLFDREALAQALRTGAGYIGMIGSRRKRVAVYESLRKDGFGEADLARVHSPIGLAIGADTPAEIAVSIVAELIKIRAESP